MNSFENTIGSILVSKVWDCILVFVHLTHCRLNNLPSWVCHRHWTPGETETGVAQDRGEVRKAGRGVRTGSGEPSGADTGTRPVKGMGEYDTGSGQPLRPVTGAGPVREREREKEVRAITGSGLRLEPDLKRK